MIPRYELLHEVRGKGLMIGVEFGPPKSLTLEGVVEHRSKPRTGSVLPAHRHPAVQGSQDPHSGRRARQPHHQAAAAADRHRDEDCDWIINSFDAVIAGSHRVPGAVWSLGKTLVGHAYAHALEETSVKIAIPDDYQDVVDKLACFSLIKHHDVTRYREPARDIDQLVERLRDADVVVSIRERVEFSRALLERLPEAQAAGFGRSRRRHHRFQGLHGARHSGFDG